MTGKADYRFLLAGGGTGGHLYPAIAVAEQIRILKPESKILFVGTKDKIEAKVVPSKGFDFKTIWVSGFSRKFKLENLLFPIKLIIAMIQSLIINIKFKPKVMIGAGAYVSGPVAIGASVMGAKIILLEQNSYPGITNRLLEKKAEQIHICFEETKKYFRDQTKLKVSGNPIRVDLQLIERSKACAEFGLDENKKVLLVLGGSLGAGNINKALAANLEKIMRDGMQIIWQTGKNYFEEYKKLNSKNIKVYPFIENMTAAYSAADLVIARAGATTIAEVAALGLPVVFIPSTVVAANHQYMNAKTLEEGNAAIIIKDEELKDKLYTVVKSLINDSEKLAELKRNIKQFSKPNAAVEIAREAIKLAEVN